MKKTIVIIAVIFCIGILAFLGVKILTQDKGKQTADMEQVLTESENNNTEATSSNAANTITTDGTMKVTIGSVSGAKGTTVTVPVNFDTVPEKGVGCCNFTIEYDNTQLEAVQVTSGEVIVSDTSDFDYAIDEAIGKVSFLFASESDKDAITKSGVFANIVFNIKDNDIKGDIGLTTGTSIGFGDTSINRINATFHEGKITIN